MNNIISSLADKVIYKMSVSISSDRHISDLYWYKWNIKIKDIIKKLSLPTLHGGLYSKAKSISNLKIDKLSTVLNIGPETGFEVFLLTELFNKIIVCDPDKDNLKLLKEISKRYKTETSILASKKIIFLPLGINNKDTFNEEKRIFNSLKKAGLSGMTTFYNITSKKELSSLDKKVDLVFIHKIFSSLVRSSMIQPEIIFKNAIQTLQRLTNKDGQISWTEPEAVWKQKNINLKRYSNSIFKYKLPKINEIYTQIVI